MKKFCYGTILWLSSLALVVLLAGCSGKVDSWADRENAAKDGFLYAVGSIAVENYNSKGEKEIQEFSQPPQRVVAVWQNSIETLLALGVGDRLEAAIGVPDEKYISPAYREAYRKVPYKSLRDLDLETILMMKPDLVVGWFSTFQPKVLRSTGFWHGRGIRTFIAPASIPTVPRKTVEMEYESILQMGRIFQKEKQAQALVEGMRRTIADVTGRARTAGLHRRGLILELAGRNLVVYGEKTLAGNILQQAGGELLAPQERQIGMERLLELNPDVIFLVTIESDYGREGEIKNRLYQNKALNSLCCIRNRHVYTLPLYTIYCSGVRTKDGIQIIAKGLYPELFAYPEPLQ